MSRIACLSAVAAFFALTTADCHARTYITCTGLCESVLPPCNGALTPTGSESPTPYQACLDFCTAIQTKCESVGHPAVFLNYVSCATDAGFSCTDAGVPVANAPCGNQQAELIQCEPADAGPEADTKLDIPDGAYQAGADCPDAGSCLACCEAAYPSGAKQYRAAVADCICGATCVCNVNGRDRSCQDECVDDAGNPGEVCAVRDGGARAPMQPVSGDRCDLCISSALDEQTKDAGACVGPVTRRCNSQVECALYMNCVSQAGCTN